MLNNDNANPEVTEPQTPPAEPAGEPSGGTQPASDPAPSTPAQDNKPGSEPTIPYSRFAEVVAERNRLRQAQQPQNPPPQAPQGEPKQEDYPTFEAFNAAVINYHVQKGIQQYATQQAQAQQQQAYQSRVAKAEVNFAQKWAEAASKDPSAIQAIQNAVIPLREDLLVNLKEHGNPIALGKHLAMDPALTMEINALPPDLAVRRMWEIGQSLAGSKTQPVSASKAPPPISPVGSGKTNTAAGYRDDMSQEEFNAAFKPMW